MSAKKESMKALACHLVSLRNAMGQTQEQIAERAGLATDTIGRLEHGSFSPSLDTLYKLARGLSTTLPALLAGLHGETEPDLAMLEIEGLVKGMTTREKQKLLRIVRAFAEKDS